MICSICKKGETSVVDSRPTEDGTAIRRRRLCVCGARFTTFERVQFREIDHKDGALNLDTIKSVYEKSKVHKPQIKTIAQENTHLASGGSIVSYSHLAEVYSFAKEKGIEEY